MVLRLLRTTKLTCAGKNQTTGLSFHILSHKNTHALFSLSFPEQHSRFVCASLYILVSFCV